jgi:oligopeptide transport system substrate-binding protein
MMLRRTLIAAAPLTLAACRSGAPQHFGRTQPPSRQRLVYLNRDEPFSLDPALVSTSKEINITRCLFEGLTRNDPVTLATRAGLATHYQSQAGGRLLTFYLRGSRNPKGTALPGSEDWPSGEPARWSDGRAITASDFVYSWRRVIDPRTGALLANHLFDVKNAEAIYTGKSASMKDLGIQAAEEFTLEVELRSPVPFFLKLTAAGVLVAVPRQAIEAAKQRGVESSWTEPGRIVVSGPFYLQERRPHDRIFFRRNPAYYDAGSVRLEELCFLQVTDGVTNVNLFKAGEADSMSDTVLPSQFLPALEGAKELHVRPALDSYFYSINVERQPFHNPLLRYALNMATDKKAVASIVGAGRAVAATYVPPLPGYRPPERLEIPLQGRTAARCARPEHTR